MPRLQSIRVFSAIAGLALGLGGLCASGPLGTPRLFAQSDLDAFMQQVIARRDDNWKKLQQYVLDERQETELRGPGGTRLWGERREYTWFIRDGFFVRSPLKVDGVTIGESDRRKYEAAYLKGAQRRETVRNRRGDGAGPDTIEADKNKDGDNGKEDDPGDAPVVPAQAGGSDVNALLRQTRQPQFISSAYFLRFKFDAGTYALAGRESFEGRDVLRVEYYPSNLFSENGRRERRDQANNEDDKNKDKDKNKDNPKNDAFGKEMVRLLNKVALVTLWIEPATHQIVKYTFDNVNFDFLPAAWLVRVNEFTASMTMGQPFPDVWLPRELQMSASASLATGTFDVRGTTSYYDYRKADVATRVGIPGAPAQPKDR